MESNETSGDQKHVDKGLVAMFIKMSPEERIQSNDNAARTIQELRDAHKQLRKDLQDKHRLPILEETLRQLQEKI